MAAYAGYRGTPAERFAAKCAPPDEHGCIIWLGALNSKGYGRILVDGRHLVAHRFAWQLVYGPIPDGMQIDHVHARGCRSTSCVNHEHLEPVSNAENQRRRAALLTHCVNGHEFAVVGRYEYEGWGRTCKACHATYVANWAARNRRRVAA